MRRVLVLPFRFSSTVGFLVVTLGFCAPVAAQLTSLDKGHQILIDRGVQISGLIALTENPFHLSTMQAGGLTMPLWTWSGDVSQLGASPGAPWGRWIDYTSQSDLTSAEKPYQSNL